MCYIEDKEQQLNETYQTEADKNAADSTDIAYIHKKKRNRSSRMKCFPAIEYFTKFNLSSKLTEQLVPIIRGFLLQSYASMFSKKNMNDALTVQLNIIAVKIVIIFFFNISKIF